MEGSGVADLFTPPEEEEMDNGEEEGEEDDGISEVFAEIQKEQWYKPEVSLYTEIILVLAMNSLYDKVDMIFVELKNEKGKIRG
ncbi:hypothetical protein Ccrd_001335 [Cynara cardunculus var. scolymus]|uniref:Uncharacterized protein n=1 Tax=Cynara cardunculus var. scolymus TaxID=59895 RepID=A0A103XTI1_CYNCS|nr:hypothetical protein Ccrd_001335 [Cynara cardunculus var. scolymus]